MCNANQMLEQGANCTVAAQMGSEKQKNSNGIIISSRSIETTS